MLPFSYSLVMQVDAIHSRLGRSYCSAVLRDLDVGLSKEGPTTPGVSIPPRTVDRAGPFAPLPEGGCVLGLGYADPRFQG